MEFFPVTEQSHKHSSYLRLLFKELLMFTYNYMIWQISHTRSLEIPANELRGPALFPVIRRRPSPVGCGQIRRRSFDVTQSFLRDEDVSESLTISNRRPLAPLEFPSQLLASV